MKNKLSDLNNHLFAQIERLSEEGLTAEQIEQECQRADAITDISDQILQVANTQLKAAALIANHGDRFARMLPEIGGTEQATALPGPGADKPSGTAPRS